MDSLRAFAILKHQLLQKYREAYPYFQGSLPDFRQKDIANFQQLLEEEQAARISEKWFYTHLKTRKNEKLPRIDTLNLLSRFAGFSSWESFCYEQEHSNHPRKIKWVLTVGLLLLLFGTVAFQWWPVVSTDSVNICFIDAIRQQPISESEITTSWLQNGQLVHYKTINDSTACMDIPSWKGERQMVCTAPYYLPDTFLLSDNKTNFELALRTDDYALMIHYFSNSKITDWKKRRQQLSEVFAEEAIIYQLDPGGQLGMDILNKTEFINKMTIPLKSLKGVEVLQTVYEKGKIVELRFTLVPM